MLNDLVTDLMLEVNKQVTTRKLATLEQLRGATSRVAQLSPSMEAKRKQTKSYLNENLYQSPALEIEHAHAEEVIATLFTEWTAHPDQLPADHQLRARQEGLPRAVADYIAGMTDTYIEQAWLSHLSRI